jgi:hypothetical protein
MKSKRGNIHMFFRRKAWLRAEFDEKLIEQIKQMKKEWDRQSTLNELSFDPFGEIEVETKIARAKYFFLLREAKQRHITIKK